MNRLSYILLPLAATGISACTSRKAEVKRPNIIFMMTDDHTTQARVTEDALSRPRTWIG